MAKIITAVGMVPGVGTTFISTNVAASLALEGINTVLVDLSAGGVLGALYMTGAPLEKVYPSIDDWREFTNIEESLLRTTYGLAVLPGRRFDDANKELPGGAVGEILECFANLFDIIIFDAGSGLHHSHIKQSINAADHILIIAEPSPRCLQAVLEYRKTGKLINNIKQLLVINRVSKNAYYHPRDIARRFGTEENYRIVEEDRTKVNESTKDRLPLVMYGRGRSCASIQKVVKEIICISKTGTYIDEGKRPKRKKNLFSGLLKKRPKKDSPKTPIENMGRCAVNKPPNNRMNEPGLVITSDIGLVERINSKQPHIIIDADLSTTNIPSLYGIGGSEIWKHDWRLGLSAKPFKVDKKTLLYTTSEKGVEVTERDIRAMSDIIDSAILEKKNIIVYYSNIAIKEALQKQLKGAD